MKILNFIKENSNWEELLSQEPYCISTTWDGKYFILKYNQIKSDFKIQLVRECRGSIFKYENGVYTCVCMPFYKFGNYGESYVKPIDWDSACITTKLDGSLIKLWYDEGWHWSTNGVIDASKAELLNGNYKTFYDLICKAVNNNFEFLDKLNKDYCFMFELTSPYNKVVVPYQETKLTLIGARNMKTYEEAAIEQLNCSWLEVFSNYGFDIIELNKLKTFEECLLATNAMGVDEEGFVVVDNNFNRAKIKSAAWLAAARLKNNGVINTERVITMIRSGCIDDFKAYCPEHADFVDEIIDKYNKLTKDLQDSWDLIKDNCFISRADFAKLIKNKHNFVKSFLFKKYTKENISVEEYLNDKSARKIAKILEDF